VLATGVTDAQEREAQGVALDPSHGPWTGARASRLAVAGARSGSNRLVGKSDQQGETTTVASREAGERYPGDGVGTTGPAVDGRRHLIDFTTRIV